MKAHSRAMAGAAVLTRQGFTSLAGAEADRAAALAAKLPRREQLRIAGQRAQWNGDSAAAIAAYQDLLALEPTDLDAGLALGVAQISARKVPEALATLAKLRRLPAPLVDDPRIDLLEARAARGTPAGKAATERAVAKAEALSANLLLARARFAEGAQFWDSPQIERALPPFEEALRLARAGGDRAQEGGIQIQMGLARWRAGAVAEGEAEVAEVIARMPASELPSLRSDALEFLADMLLYRLELKRSREASEEARALCRQLEASDAELNQRGWLGVIAYLEGDLAAGRRELEAAREGLVRLEAEFYREDIALALGWLELEAGNLEAAERLARESAPESPHAPHENLWLAEALWLEGMVAVARDELPLAQEKLERARQLLEGSSLRPNAAELLLSLAERA
ncbi:MAG TPA: tetratricopeptide repeat protein, partial [Thermoanaerobaculia bacterium]|nr:tetratricopeptide repeat protein [Thermoanaerobaculia bacterium]